MKVRGSDRRHRHACRERFELSLELVAQIDHRMADLGAVEPARHLVVVGRPHCRERVCGNCDAALTMDVIDLGRRTQSPVHGLLDADRDDVLGRTVNLFARQHGRTARNPRKPAGDLAVEHLIVTGDRNRIEALATGFEHESPRRHAVAAPRRAVDVKVGGEHAIAAKGHRWPDNRSVPDGSDDHRQEDQAGGDSTQTHQPPNHAAAAGWRIDQAARPSK